eukprot:353199-Chlamydomonas_euryale.AAC.4
MGVFLGRSVASGAAALHDGLRVWKWERSVAYGIAALHDGLRVWKRVCFWRGRGVWRAVLVHCVRT